MSFAAEQRLGRHLELLVLERVYERVNTAVEVDGHYREVIEVGRETHFVAQVVNEIYHLKNTSCELTLFPRRGGGAHFS